MENGKYDIVIVGGGATGLSLAAFLSDLDLKILLLESRQYPLPQYSVERSIALNSISKLILTELGCFSDLENSTTPIKKVHVSKQGIFGTCKINSNDYNVDALGYVVSLSKLENLLYNRALACDNVALVTAAKLEHIKQKDNYDLEYSIMDELGAVNKNSVTTRFVIAADGTNSIVKKEFGILTDRSKYKQQALVANLQHSLSHENTAYERFTNDGAIAMLPFGKNKSTMVITCEEELANYLKNLSEEELKENIQDKFGYRLGKFNVCSEVVSFPLAMQISQKQYGHNYLLVGNAAHTLHPVAAQGFNLSLRDVKFFVDILKVEIDSIKKDLVGEESKDNAKIFNEYLNIQIVLEKYAEKTSSDQDKVIGFTDKLVKHVSGNKLPSLLNSAGLLAIDSLLFCKNKIANLGMGMHAMDSVLGDND